MKLTGAFFKQTLFFFVKPIPLCGVDHGATTRFASAERQFEFAQNVWANDRNFHELGNERDPVIGSQDGTFEFKIPKRPIRKKITGLPAFTTVKGGAYFFLPSIKALRYLGHGATLGNRSATPRRWRTASPR
jgi:deferrochelatase/peroxidase EfeB